ncbi:siderophore-interacting protein [Rhizobium rhizogenes]|uniref:siderophore-interacting protein n=1 Tax=Rhizobium rhizogenes TaxID=359 RepID=UPI00080FF7EE|nr:siderophore-interacting protein [Rhizobium rhizogenes]NTI44113.1 siderophore-interacting protein [Rhizobium rhizogenes]OCJ18645.1 NADPH-dependent ferric siderophore reductase [Agrobacterium sp. B131/95]
MQASTIIRSDRAGALVTDFAERFRDVADVEAEGGKATLISRYGRADLTAQGDAISIAVAAKDQIDLCYIKMVVAEYFSSAAAPDAVRWSGDGEAESSLPPFFREMRVISVENVTPQMRRLRLSGAELNRFAADGLHVRLLFPPRGAKPVWPALGADGRIVWPGGDDRLVSRVYTIRSRDSERGEIEIDFALHHHEDGRSPGASFAVHAQPGDLVGLFAPAGDEIPKAQSLVLCGDDTALPAIARILEEIPSSVSARLFIEIDNPDCRYELRSGDNIELNYLYRQGRPAGTTGLLPEALSHLDADSLGEDTYFWAGCEFGDFVELRKLARRTWKLPRERHLVVAFWRRGFAEGESAKQA